MNSWLTPVTAITAVNVWLASVHRSAATAICLDVAGRFKYPPSGCFSVSLTSLSLSS
jgi:hypothetical protein